MQLLDRDSIYCIEDASTIFTPALVVFAELVEKNIQKMVSFTDNPSRLRPHCKTHKTKEIIELQQRYGITKQKAATIAEVEMLATAGVKDILLAYNLVGPNIARAVEIAQSFSDMTFSVTVDAEDPLVQLGSACNKVDEQIEVLLDLDMGFHRTGVQPGRVAQQLYGRIASTSGLIPGGLHVYDGRHHQSSRAERVAAVQETFEEVLEFRDTLTREGWPVPRIVCGATGTFPIYAEMDDLTIEVCPGTCIYWDAGYDHTFPDLDFTPAAGVLTRVISCPTEDRVSLDVGCKGIASDPSFECRVLFPELPDAEPVIHNEEHLVIKTKQAGNLKPGDELLGIPWHICPTSVLYPHAIVIRGGRVDGRWIIAARDRCLTV